MIGGLAGVTTAPSQRRRGHVAGLLRAWFQRLHERGIGLSGDYPFDPAFYARYGYQVIENSGRLELPIERLPTGTHDAVQIGPARYGELKQIHAAYASRFSLALTRANSNRDQWQYVIAPSWREQPYDVFLMDGAYVVVGIDEGDDGPTFPKVFVRDYAYSSPAGRAAILAFLADLAGQVVRVKIHLAHGDPLLTLWSSRYGSETHSYQVRVVDVTAALAPLRSERESSFTLQLHDEDCPWNDGVFAVELTQAGAVVRRSSATGTRARVAMGIGAFAALLFGATDPATSRATGLVEGDLGPLVDLSRLLAGHPSYIPEADHY
jgi:predicted acetyltransferase